MRFVKRILPVAMSLTLCLSLWADTTDSIDATYTIVDQITLSGIHTVSQPDALLQRLVPPQQRIEADDNDSAESFGTSAHTGGYRIQVFSDSNPRTARNEAGAKAGNISARFPEYRPYVTYDAPYWRLRIGDFRTYEDATDAMEAIKEAFPSYRRELRVVRDRINVN